MTSDFAPSLGLYGRGDGFPDVMDVETVMVPTRTEACTIRPHRHPHIHQFVLVRSGETRVMVDGQVLHPAPPFLVSIPMGVVHGFVFPRGVDAQVISVPRTKVPEDISEAFGISDKLSKFALVPADTEIQSTFEKLTDEHRQSQDARPIMLMALLTQIACLVIRQLDQTERSGADTMDARVVKFIALVDQNVRHHWSVDDFANAIGISSRHLNRLCLQDIGTSPSKYIEAVVVREARRLLAYTTEPVTAIAYDLGFEDPAYFSRLFRRHTGLYPKLYRSHIETQAGSQQS